MHNSQTTDQEQKQGFRRHLVEFAHYHATLIRSRVRSSEESVYLLSACLMLLGCWNVPHQQGVLLGPSHSRRTQSVPQIEHLLVCLPQAVVGHNGHPVYTDDIRPYSRTVLLYHNKIVRKYDSLRPWLPSFKSTAYINVPNTYTDASTESSTR